MLCMAAMAAVAAPQPKSRAYTAEKPLVYEGSWDLWPYSFLNEQGEPDGFSIELIKLLLNELDIPYVIKLKSNEEAFNDLRDGRSDLRMGLASGLHDEYGHYSQNAVTLFTQSVASPKNQPIAIHTLHDLSKNKVIVYKNSLCQHLMEDYGWGSNAIPYADISDIIQKVNDEEKGQIVWNTLSLKWLIRKYKLDNLQLSPVDMPHGEYKFMSNDTQLLAQLDSIYTVLHSADKITAIQNKWFYPERKQKEVPAWFWWISGALAIMASLLLYYFINYRIRGLYARREIAKRNKRLSLILETSQIRLWTYDTATTLFTWHNDRGQAVATYNKEEFAARYHEGDFDRLLAALNKVESQECEDATLEVKARDAEDDKQEHDFIVTLSVLRKDRNGNPAVILGTKRDVTKERRMQHEEQALMLRYNAIFETPMTDVIFYDKDGYLSDLNKRACETFQCDHDSIVKERITFQEVMAHKLDGYQYGEHDFFHTTLLMDFDESRKEGRLASASERQGKMYYELLLKAVYDDQKQFMGVLAIGRDRSMAINSIGQVRQSIQRLSAVNKDLTEYVTNINYILRESGVRIAEYSPTSHTLTIYSGINEVQYALTQARCMTLVDDRYKKKAMRLLTNMDNHTTTPIGTDIRTAIRARGGQMIHLEFHLIPVTDTDGTISTYFGLCRNITELKATEQQLVLETAKAQEVENAKNSFLKNMSYEIRTPLNAVVGFAEMFETPHSQEDEAVFVNEILDNSDQLLHLINNILFLSRLDAHMIDFCKQPIDFALLFEGQCQQGWERHQKTDVKYIVENPYQQLILDIDATNLGQVIQRVVENAAQHTTGGTIRCRYDYVGRRLMLTVEDTGTGIPPEELEHIFERFVSGFSHGSGLGLPICKELMEQMGGTIEISSEVGLGTTVWLTLPCQATIIKRKKN